MTVEFRFIQTDFKTIFCAAAYNQNGMP